MVYVVSLFFIFISEQVAFWLFIIYRHFILIMEIDDRAVWIRMRFWSSMNAVHHQTAKGGDVHFAVLFHERTSIDHARRKWRVYINNGRRETAKRLACLEGAADICIPLELHLSPLPSS